MIKPSTVASLFSLALDSITHRRLRAFLTMLGIFIGVASVVALVSLGQGLSESVNASFNKIGTDKLMITPGSTGITGTSFSPSPLTDHDLAAVRRIIGVSKVSYSIVRSTRLTHGQQTIFARVSGIPTSADDSVAIKEFRSITVETGRDLSQNDKTKALVGYGLATGTAFTGGLKVNDILAINGTEFRVNGILKKVGDPSIDNGLIIPLDEAKVVFHADGVYDAIVLKLDKGIVPSSLVDQVERELRRSRGVTKDHQDFTVQTSEQLIASFNTIFNLVQAIVVGIAAISLLVGAVGIMNTMYTSVLERTKEIGVMKAIGAKNSEILILFMIESGMLGLVGGIIGVIIGFILAKSAEIIADSVLGTNLITAYFTPELVLGALVFSLVLGSVSGAFPAMQAAKLRPVDALRYE